MRRGGRREVRGTGRRRSNESICMGDNAGEEFRVNIFSPGFGMVLELGFDGV